jgi:hypothetical protein
MDSPVPSHTVGKKRRAKKSFADVTDRSKRSRVNELLAPAVQLANELGETRSEDQAALFNAVGRHLEGKPKVSSFANSKGTICSDVLKRAAAEYRHAVDAADRTRKSQVLSIFRSLGRSLTRDVCNEEYFSLNPANKYHVSKYDWQWGGMWLGEKGFAGQKGAEIFKETHKRLDVEEVIRVIQFLCMDSNLQHWAYGVRHYILSNGSLRTLPKCTAKLPSKDLLCQYNHECQLRGEPEVCESDFRLAMKIISGNSKDQLATALDPIRVKDGIDNFRAMRRFVQDVAPSKQVQDDMITQIDDLEVFLRTEFSQHFSELSSTGIHAYNYTFGAQLNPAPIQVSSA